MNSMRKGSLYQVKALLQHLNEPSQLLKDELVAAHFKMLRQPIPQDPLGLRKIVREFVTAAVALLTPRQRSIIIRADLRGEVHRALAASLGISERYFYKERRQALVCLANVLVTAVPFRQVRIQTADATADNFEYVEALKRVGSAGSAIVMLEAVVASDTSADFRLRAASGLPLLLADVGSLNAAARALDVARGLLNQSQVSVEEALLPQNEIELADAKITWLRASVSEAEAKVRRVIANLHGSFSENKNTELLGAALLLLFDILAYRGVFGEMLTIALDAQEALEDTPNSVLAVRTLGAVAYAQHYVTGTTAMSTQNLILANDMAMRIGAVSESLSMTMMLCGMYMLRGEPKRGLDLALPRMSTARFTAPAEALIAYFNVSLATSLAGQAPVERALIGQAMAQMPPRSRCPPLLQLAAAEAAISEKRYAEALSLATSAGAHFEATLGTRLFGHALFVQALANEGLDNHRKALHLIREAVKACEQFGSPFSRYRAYSISNTLSGKRKHARNAAEVLASLQA